MKNFNIKNKKKRKSFFSLNTFLIFSVFILLLSIGVYAVPSVVGHTLGEITPPSYCGSYNDGYLMYYSGGWRCGNAPSSDKIPIITSCSVGYGLQWTGSVWQCIGIDCPDCGAETCEWSGWEDVCDCYLLYNPGTCGGEVAIPMTQRYCSGGLITNSRIVYCCPSVGGTCVFT